MSYEIDIREELIIHNENEKTRAAAAKLADYIRQFDRMDGLSGMQIYSMELEADGKIAYTDDEVSTKECGYIFMDSADGDPLVKLVEEDYSHWDDDEDTALVAASLEDAKTIALRLDCSLQVASETSYGAAFWQDFLQNMGAADFGELVRYRNAEFYTAAEPVCCYSYQHGEGQKHQFELAAEGEGPADQSWYSYCLSMEFDGEGGAFEDEAAREKLGELVDAFSAAYDLETTWETMKMDAEIEAVEAADAGSEDSTADVCFVINEEFGLLEGEDKDLLEDLQTLADFAGECGAEVRLHGEFFSDRGDFTFMSIGIEEGKVQAKYCSF